MAQINTRIVLRNDTAANWLKVAKTAQLMVGEMGVETDTGLFKIGKAKSDGTLYTWEELEYANDTSALQNSVTEVDAFSKLPTTGNNIGDIGIVKAIISQDEKKDAQGNVEKDENGNVIYINQKYSYTSYVWSEVTEGSFDWAAMDGNYDASNVYFKNDITLAGSYTAVGNVTKSSNAATGTLSAAGKSLDQVMQSIFTKELYPAKNASRDVPNITLEGDKDGTGEVGSSYTLPTVQVRVTDVGSYAYGPATDIKFAVGNMTIAQGAVASATNKNTNTKVMVDESTLSLTATDTATLYTDSAKSYTFNAEGTYTAGAVPKTNLGNLLDNNDDASTWTYRIPSGKATATARTVKRTGYRYMFCGGTTESTITSAVVRAFTAKKNSKPTNASSALEFTAAGGTTKVICAYPSSWTGTPYFEMFGLAWAENSNFAAKSNIYVADARGTVENGTLTGALNDNEKKALNGPIEYKIYAWELDAPLEAETTKFRVYFK